MERLKREQLHSLKYRTVLLISGFGGVALRSRTGLLIKVTKTTIVLKCKEGGESYLEVFSKRSGIRLKDIGNQDGWCIKVSEALNTRMIIDAEPVKSSVMKVHEGTKVITNNESVIVQVWKQTLSGGIENFYLKSFRRVLKVTDNTKGEKVVITKEYPAMVPFDKLLEVFHEFVDWSK